MFLPNTVCVFVAVPSLLLLSLIGWPSRWMRNHSLFVVLHIHFIPRVLSMWVRSRALCYRCAIALLKINQHLMCFAGLNVMCTSAFTLCTANDLWKVVFITYKVVQNMYKHIHIVNASIMRAPFSSHATKTYQKPRDSNAEREKNQRNNISHHKGQWQQNRETEKEGNK